MKLWRLTALGILLAGGLALTACSTDSGNEAGAGARAADAGGVTTTVPASTDSTAICAVFNQLVAGGAGPGAQFQASTPEGWQRRIATTAQLAAVAPAEWRDEAETYLQMVKDRAQLAADNGYVGVNDLPTDVREDFISSHRDMQRQVDALIAWMSGECPRAASA